MPTDTDHPETHTMSFGDHLEELRRRVLWALLLPLPLSIVTFIVSNPIIEWLYMPLDRVLRANDLPQRLQVLAPPEFLVTKIKLSLITALIIALPWIVWQGWKFARPGLYQHERRFVYFLVPGSFLLTAAGLALMYFAMLPLMLQVLVVFGTSLQPMTTAPPLEPQVQAILDAEPSIELRAQHPQDPQPGDAWLKVPEMELYVAVEAEMEAEDVAGAEGGDLSEVADASPAADDERAEPGGTSNPGNPGVRIVRVPQPPGPIVSQEFRLTTYINFVLVLMLGIAIAFQMPLVILLLGWLGLATPEWLKAKRRFALLICGAIAAVTTPADVISMVAMLIPLYALYELGILLVRFVPASAVAEGTILKRRQADRAD
ncbi:MAG: twin-arginine translocase subunit TatC [Planctomycetota bacterium]|jgi:sec-independent protein translocase protein TatC